MSAARSLATQALVLALVAGACSGGSDEATTADGSTSSTADFSDVPDEIAQILEADFQPAPASLLIEPRLVAPGETITVSGLQGLAGLSLYGPDGTASEVSITGSSAVVDVPLDAANGLHLALAETSDGFPVAATFRVADGPFLGLSLDNGMLVAEADGLSLDLLAVITVGSGEDAGFLEAGPGGLLLPVYREPTATLGDYLGVRLELPPTASGELRLQVPENEGSSVRSNAVTLERCVTNPVLVGDLGGPGEVRAVWTGSQPGSVAAESDTGPYRISTGPGLVAVTEYPAGAEPRTMVVTARCDGEKDLTEAGASADSFSVDGLADDSWTGAVTGARELVVDEGVALCTADGDSVEISLLDDFDFTIGLVATIDGFAGSGPYRSGGVFLGEAGEFAEAAFTLQVEETADGRLLGTFSGDAAIESGNIEFAGAFRCALEHFDGAGEPGGTFASYQSGAGHEPCRIGYINTTGTGAEVALILARRLAAGNPLIEWYTSGDIKALLATAAEDQRTGGDGSEAIEAAQRAVAGDYYVTVTIREFPGTTGDKRWWAILKALDVERGRIVARAASSGPDLESLRIIPKSGAFIAAIGRSGICGYADPVDVTLAPGEKQEFTYEVVDLLDVGVFDAQVSMADREDGAFSPDCGAFDRLTGTTGAGAFEPTFTAADEIEQDCTEYPRFSATSGDLKTKPEREPQADATVHVGSKWEYEASLVLRTPDGDLTWRVGSSDEPGVFYVRESGAIVGGGPGVVDGTRSCEVRENGVLTFKEPPTAIGGTWLSYLSGSFVEGEYFEFRFDGNGWNSSWPPLPAECADAILSPIGEAFLRVFGYRIGSFTIHPVRLTPEATTVTFAVDPSLDAEFVITIRPAQPDTGN